MLQKYLLIFHILEKQNLFNSPVLKQLESLFYTLIDLLMPSEFKTAAAILIFTYLYAWTGAFAFAELYGHLFQCVLSSCYLIGPQQNQKGIHRSERIAAPAAIPARSPNAICSPKLSSDSLCTQTCWVPTRKHIRFSGMSDVVFKNKWLNMIKKKKTLQKKKR